MSTDATPPVWAEALLRAVVTRRDFDSVSGDLLEEYREAVYPARGQQGADTWYVVQVFGFAIRSVGVWGALFGLAEVVRTALDWFVPTHDFSVRSAVSTYVGIALLLATGFWSAWRSGSLASGPVSATLAVTTILVRPGSGLIASERYVLRPITTGLPEVSARKCRMSDLSRHGMTPPRPITPFSATAAMSTMSIIAPAARGRSARPR